jgi:hypothetical protein
MELSSLESTATTLRHAVVFFATGVGISGCLAYFSAITKDERKRLGYQLAAAILAVSGAGFVALNFYYTDQISIKRDRLSRDKDAELERFKLQKDTEIKQLEKDNLMLRQQVGVLEKNNLTLRTKVAAVEVEEAHARERAAKAEKDLLEIQEQIKPRRITDEQRNRLFKLFTGSSKGPVRINVVLGDGEALYFAKQFQDILKKSGWTDVHVSQSVRTGSPVGITMVVKDGNKDPVFAQVLLDAFSLIRLEVKRSYQPTFPDETVGILVGMKPS